jgi:hypothetical protein
MARGGTRPGAGRPAGASNRRTIEQIEAIEASGLTPLDFMLDVLRDELRPFDARMDAAKAAAPYCHAKRAPVGSDGEDAPGLTVIVNKP